MRKSVYLETSIPRRYFDNNDILRRDATRYFWEHRLPKYDTFISDVVLEELNYVKDKAFYSELKTLVKGFDILPRTLDSEALAEYYMKNNVVPKHSRNDAIHLAIATLGKMDCVVSWNLKHIANSKTQEKIRTFNKLHGHNYIELATPVELE